MCTAKLYIRIFTQLSLRSRLHTPQLPPPPTQQLRQFKLLCIVYFYVVFSPLSATAFCVIYCVPTSLLLRVCCHFHYFHLIGFRIFHGFSLISWSFAYFGALCPSPCFRIFHDIRLLIGLHTLAAQRLVSDFTTK